MAQRTLLVLSRVNVIVSDAQWKRFLMKKTKKIIGRPRIDPAATRSARRYVGLQHKEAAMFDSIAAEKGKSFSAWARGVLLANVRQLNSNSS
jgi:hypothetical protein